MSRLSDVTNAAIVNLLGFRNETVRAAAVNLAINAATAATVKTNGALSYTNNGVSLYKAALAAQSIVPTAGLVYVQPVNTTVYYSIGLDAAGVVSVTQGSYVGQMLSQDPTKGVGISQGGTSYVGDGAIPDVPAGVTPIGIIKVVTNGATTFTAGTTALDAAGLTVTYYDVQVMPSGKL